MTRKILIIVGVVSCFTVGATQKMQLFIADLGNLGIAWKSDPVHHISGEIGAYFVPNYIWDIYKDNPEHAPGMGYFFTISATFPTMLFGRQNTLSPFLNFSSDDFYLQQLTPGISFEFNKGNATIGFDAGVHYRFQHEYISTRINSYQMHVQPTPPINRYIFHQCSPMIRASLSF
jgi:hypothetical protein